ncbi:hypothetical protein ABIE85_002136 [Bradyrhizobium diazoefficiens]|uniref:hypothetical protein n=1 Tax=Bradyrhizobium diazoefficiens TaxID=1355477 RepID=UPI001B561541|nr:hypothetical protein [Bradyrhizobium diazoefficiens]MBP1092691.1 hypothetical protein [Bradyrhizobium japonicum]WLA60907.1 hypothetical protein QIH81_20255 [Bradyrhizobium diazoefficiens]
MSALAVIPPFVAEGVVIVDNATEVDIALKQSWVRRVTNFVSPLEPAARTRKTMKHGQPPSKQPQDERPEKAIPKEINQCKSVRWIQDALEDDEVRDVLRRPVDYVRLGDRNGHAGDADEATAI